MPSTPAPLRSVWAWSAGDQRGSTRLSLRLPATISDDLPKYCDIPLGFSDLFLNFCVISLASLKLGKKALKLFFALLPISTKCIYLFCLLLGHWPTDINGAILKVNVNIIWVWDKFRNGKFLCFVPISSSRAT